MPAPQTRAWCFTLNNPQVEPERPPNVQYLIFGREIAPATGTPHLQGFVYFTKPQRLSGCQAWLPTAHWTACDGTPEQNITYCKKGGDFLEQGDPPAPRGKKSGDVERARWSTARLAAQEGRFADVPDDIYVRY